MLLKAEVVELSSVWANGNEVFDVNFFPGLIDYRLQILIGIV